MIIGLGLILTEFVFYHLIAHALLKSILFILAGYRLYSRDSNQDMRNLNSRALPLSLRICYFLNALNIACAPFLGL